MSSPTFRLENTTMEMKCLMLYVVSDNIFVYAYILFVYAMFASWVSVQITS
jgi:hypothetical protein